MYWPRLSQQKIRFRIYQALSDNVNYTNSQILGVPGSFLDNLVFKDGQASEELNPFFSVLLANPNHIGCHTIENSQDSIFAGTQKLETDVVRICAEEIFKASPGSYDGYVTVGGTEANVEALWIYRNYFMKEEHAVINEIGLVYSEDSHYSIAKSGDLLGIESIVCRVNEHSREIDFADLEEKLHKAVKKGINYFIVVANMSTVMFGSTDNIEKLCTLFNIHHLNFKLHVDATFGGFMYPFSNNESLYRFTNPAVSSIALDAHRILQAPYGCGVFLARKELVKYVQSPEVTYVKGTDHTLNGSRNGAGAVAIWMILHAYGSGNWATRMSELAEKTNNFSHRLHEAGIAHFHEPNSNVICIRSEFVPAYLASEYYLVPDTHKTAPNWYRIVIMPQTRSQVLDHFLNRLAERSSISPR